MTPFRVFSVFRGSSFSFAPIRVHSRFNFFPINSTTIN